MKTLKRAGSFALAVLLVFALSTAALAEDGSADTLSQSVTISNLASGETVNVYRLISYAEGYNGYVTDAAFGAYLNGLTGAGADAKKDPSKWASGSVDVTQLLEGYVAACSGGKLTLPALYDEKTADGTSVTFTLAPGYYMMLVSTTLTSGKVYRPLSVFVKVTGEKSEVFGGGLDRALTTPLTAKGEDAPKLDKMVKTAGSTWSKTGDAAVGDTVSFYLEVTVPRYTDVSKVSLAVEDTLTNLVYNGDAKLYDVVPDGSANEIAGGAMTAANDGGKLTFTLDYAKLMAAGTMRTVYIGYTATVAASAAEGENHSASNTAKLVYGNAAMPGELLQTPSVATTVYNFSFELRKYFIDANDNLQPLGGAEFTFYTDAGCTNALTFTQVGDVYRPALAGETGVTAVPALVKETGVTGVTAVPANLTICGLDAGTYYMKETKTPKGYAPPAGAYRMTLVSDGETGKLHPHDSSLTSASGTKADKDLIYHAHFSGSNLERLVISFLNTKLPALPSTGGIGTAVFTVGGVAVMALAIVLLLRRKKQED